MWLVCILIRTAHVSLFFLTFFLTNNFEGIGSLTDEDVGESNDASGNNQQNFDEYFDGLSILEKFFRLCEAQKLYVYQNLFI
jgi:hypothetical protein